MRKASKIVLGIAFVIAVPIFIDFFVFGNALHRLTRAHSPLSCAMDK